MPEPESIWPWPKYRSDYPASHTATGDMCILSGEMNSENDICKKRRGKCEQLMASELKFCLMNKFWD